MAHKKKTMLWIGIAVIFLLLFWNRIKLLFGGPTSAIGYTGYNPYGYNPTTTQIGQATTGLTSLVSVLAGIFKSSAPSTSVPQQTTTATPSNLGGGGDYFTI